MRIIGTSINMRYIGKLDLNKSKEYEKYSDKVKHRIDIIEFLSTFHFYKNKGIIQWNLECLNKSKK